MKRAVNALQNFGKSLYGPVLILPIVGLFIAFGNVLGNGNLAEYLPFLGHPLIQSIGQLITKSAVSVLVNLALVFAVGIPIGLATRDKGYAALIGLVGGLIGDQFGVLETFGLGDDAAAMDAAGKDRGHGKHTGQTET